MIERTLVENIQRKQGALDVYEAIISLIEQRKGVGKLKKEEKGVYESLLAEIKAMKHGLNNFQLGFHEQVER